MDVECPYCSAVVDVTSLEHHVRQFDGDGHGPYGAVPVDGIDNPWQLRLDVTDAPKGETVAGDVPPVDSVVDQTQRGREVEHLDPTYIADLCGSDWGLYKTVTTNLDRVDALRTAIEDRSKSLRWFRSRRRAEAAVPAPRARIAAERGLSPPHSFKPGRR